MLERIDAPASFPCKCPYDSQKNSPAASLAVEEKLRNIIKHRLMREKLG